jgi:hypothetical protein
VPEKMSVVSRRFTVLFLLSFVFSIQLSLGQIGGTSDNSSNPTGGFGQTDFTSDNPTGGFGAEEDIVPGVPPPPPEPVPLDGGVSLLIAAAVGYGAKKLYGEVKNK